MNEFVPGRCYKNTAGEVVELWGLTRRCPADHGCAFYAGREHYRWDGMHLGSPRHDLVKDMGPIGGDEHNHPCRLPIGRYGSRCNGRMIHGTCTSCGRKDGRA